MTSKSRKSSQLFCLGLVCLIIAFESEAQGIFKGGFETVLDPPCSNRQALIEQNAAMRQWYDELTAGLDTTPVDRVLDDSGNGLLQAGLSPDVLPVLTGPAGIHMAVTKIGEGRVVAFSGQDFLSSYDRSSLLTDPGIPSLLHNAVAWASGGSGAALSILADNDAVANVLSNGTGHELTTTTIVQVQGLREIRDWSAGTIAGHDVLVVQINEWGTLHLADEDLPAIRNFVSAGGGLIIAGAAAHWSWWLSDQGPDYPGDALLREFGLTWLPVIVGDMTTATLSFDKHSSPEALWCAYILGDKIQDEALPRVAPLFGAAAQAGRSKDVDAALQRLIDQSPALPVSADNAAARLAADISVLLRGQPWPSGHPWASTFPGDVAVDSERVSFTVSIDTSWKRHRPLGAYAAPGDVVSISLPQEHVGTGLSIRIGESYDDLRGLGHIDTWRRAPLLTQQYNVTELTTTLGNGIGGALYLEVPDNYIDTNIEVQLNGVVPMAVHTADETDDITFAVALDAGAPQAIFQREGNISMVVDSGEAAAADPSAPLDFWSGFYQSHADLAQEPTPRLYTSHWLFDPQVGWGYANAIDARINYPELATGWALRTQTGNEDWWLFAHEMGHQFQTLDWTSGDITEVGVNLWSMFTINGYINNGGNFESRGHQGNVMDHAALIGSRWGEVGLFEKLELYRQLVFEFGWQVFKDVMASYYNPAFPRDEFGSFMDGFALRFSAITGQDITPFLMQWEYPLSAAARSKIQGWGLPEWLPPGW